MGQPTRARLPRFAVAVLRWTLPRDRAIEVAGDLEEAGCRDMLSPARLTLSALAIGVRGAAERARRVGVGALIDDARESGRHVRRSPAVTLAVAATLAVAIGANATMFQVIDRLLLSPPDHIAEPDRVSRLLIERGDKRTGERAASAYVTYPDYRDFDRATTFETAGYTTLPMVVGRGATAERLQTGWASASFFPLLGVQPALGRFYGPDEDGFDVPPVAVAGYEWWQTRHGGDPEILGRSVYVRGTEFVVVGVAPPGFTGVDLQQVDLWLPLHVAGTRYEGEGFDSSRGWYWFQIIARVLGDAPAATARAEATAIHRAGRADYIAQDRYDPEVEVLFRSLIVGRGSDPTGASRVAGLVAGVTAIVLLIACANVGSLLLNHGLARRREMAVRVALGVSRARLARLMLGEALWMAGLGGGVGLLVAFGGGRLLQTTLLPNVTLTQSVVSLRVLGFTAAAAILAGILAAVAPAMLAGAADPARDLKTGGHGASAGVSRVRQLLAVTQGVLAVLLLVGAGLFVRSLWQVRALDLGLRPEGLAMVRLLLEPRDWDDAARGRLFDDALTAVETVPGVESGAITSSIPFAGSWSVSFAVPGVESDKPASGGPYVYAVTPGYFDTLGMRLLAGRLIEEADRGAAPVAVVTESMARGIWPDGEGVGECVVIGAPENGCTRVVGIVADTRRQELIEREQWLYYLPIDQGFAMADLRPGGLVLRAPGDLQATLPLVRARLLELPGIEFVSGFPFGALTEPQERSWRLGATLFSLFGGLATLMAALGLYSVLAFGVARRRRELGIRSALGAPPGQIAALVFRHALGIAVVSIGLGLAAAAAAAPLLSPLLFGVSARDPLVLATVAATLLAAALLVTVGPAIRARAVNPVEVLGGD